MPSTIFGYDTLGDDPFTDPFNPYTAGTNPSTVTVYNKSAVSAGQFFIISR